MAHKDKVSQLDGLGRKMPFTFGAFCVASFSIIGLPPLGGAWSKWFLVTGAFEAGHFWLGTVFMVSSLLSIGYLMPIVVRAFFRPLPEGEEEGVADAPLQARFDGCFGDMHAAGVFCEAIYRTPIPLAYTRHTSRFIMRS